MKEIIEEVGQLLEPMLQRRLFVCLSEPTSTPEEMLPHLPEHLHHLIELERQGVIFAAGPFMENDRPAQNGLIIIRAESKEAARKILEEEPLHKRGLRSFELHEWSLNEGRVTLHVDFSNQTGGLDGQVPAA